ncbi:myb-like protein D [Colias croceus]|uniref:myb-like protein D n=1 Tax=Colias crocea TaxID=72248 RepID=UPI001E2818C5|nr:myb-like protein D [Colias croceus]
MHVKIPIFLSNDKRKISLRIDDANLNKYNQARRHIIKDKVLTDSNKIREDDHEQDTTLKLTENNARRLINNFLKLHDTLARRNNDHDNIDMRELNARRNLEHSDHNNLEANGGPSFLYNIRRYANNNEETNHNFRRDNTENKDLNVHRQNLEHNTDGRRQGLILLSLDEDHYNNNRNENIQQNFDVNDNEFKNLNDRRLLGYIPNKEKYRPNIILLSLNNPDLKEINALLHNNYMENRRNFQRVKSQGHSYAEAIQESNLLNHLKKIRRGKARRDDKNDEEELRYDLEDDRLIWNIE